MRRQLLMARRRLLALAPARLRLLARSARFGGSASYWETRYARGGTSGAGSYGHLARFKADVIDGLIRELGITSVIEIGCGDGNQLALIGYPKYVGLDVSRTAIRRCESRFSSDESKSFFLYDPTCFTDNGHIFVADAALSLDILFHLVEDELFAAHLNHLFAAARRHVIIYSSNRNLITDSPHERHRAFTGWIDRNQPEWYLLRRIPNLFSSSEDEMGSLSDFYVYARADRLQPDQIETPG